MEPSTVPPVEVLQVPSVPMKVPWGQTIPGASAPPLKEVHLPVELSRVPAGHIMAVAVPAVPVHFFVVASKVMPVGQDGAAAPVAPEQFGNTPVDPGGQAPIAVVQIPFVPIIEPGGHDFAVSAVPSAFLHPPVAGSKNPAGQELPAIVAPAEVPLIAWQTPTPVIALPAGQTTPMAVAAPVALVQLPLTGSRTEPCGQKELEVPAMVVAMAVNEMHFLPVVSAGSATWPARHVTAPTAEAVAPLASRHFPSGDGILGGGQNWAAVATPAELVHPLAPI